MSDGLMLALLHCSLHLPQQAWAWCVTCVQQHLLARLHHISWPDLGPSPGMAKPMLHNVLLGRRGQPAASPGQIFMLNSPLLRAGLLLQKLSQWASVDGSS